MDSDEVKLLKDMIIFRESTKKAMRGASSRMEDRSLGTVCMTQRALSSQAVH